jgi:hypothetical protein
VTGENADAWIAEPGQARLGFEWLAIDAKDRRSAIEATRGAAAFDVESGNDGGSRNLVTGIGGVSGLGP